jgi:putative colanic acid biosynthesis UDP-glucose lipid carrier transferase
VGLFEALGDTTASVFYVPDFGVFDQFQARVIEVESMPVLEIIETPIYGVDGLIKQLFDKVFSIAALLFAGIPMLVIALLIRLDSPGPILFRQRRYGLNGREFRVLKFRTMYTGSERVADTRQATRGDPRITPIGHFLRRTSLDELPQFINVLLGDMSVVGPRPHTVDHNEYYRKEIKRYMSRHKVKPGVTGLSQVSGLRGETADVGSMAERIRMDIEYIRNWSLMLDVGIILQTVVKVFKDRNAY